MAEDETPKPPRRRRIKSKPGIGTWIGRLLFVGLCVVGTLLYLDVREIGFETTAKNLRAIFFHSNGSSKEEDMVAYIPMSGGRVVDAVDADTRPLHEQDPRWEAAIALAEEGVKQREDALHQHYEVEGDPFILRAQMSQAFDKLEAALLDLRTMRAEYSSSKESCMQLDFQIERFEKVVNSMNEKHNRR